MSRRTQVVTAAVIEREGRILIAQRKETGLLPLKWEFPGGKLEQNETAEECLRRELLEEFNINVKVCSLLCESVHSSSDITIELMSFITEYISGDFVLNDHEAIEWVFVDQLLDYDFADADLAIIQVLLDRNKQQP